MTGVFIAADDQDKKMWRTLPGILARHFSVQLLEKTGGRPQKPREDADLLFSDLPGAASLHPEQAIVIFKKADPAACAFPCGEKTVALVDAGGGGELLEQVSGTRLPAITCGLSARDTITLSSIGADSAVITVQRSLACFDGSIVEPQEIPVHLDAPIDSFTLMAAAAVYLLTGRIQALDHAQFGHLPCARAD